MSDPPRPRNEAFPVSQHATVPPEEQRPETRTGDWPAVPGYEILGELGRGGMGVVYKARQLSLKRTVAVKMILAGSFAGPRELARFRTEAVAVARLQHPNIVQVYEVGDLKGCPYFSLEYVPGGSLAEHLDGKPWPARRAARLVETLARAVNHAHRQGIVHRDLKPANVLVGQEEIPKITDFGLAKQLDSEAGLTPSDAVLGTPSYMAPEQANGKYKRVGPAADIYSLGAILYELLTGRPPFEADTPLDTIMQVVSEEPVPPRVLRPKLARDLETVCLKCLHKQPERRYRSARALAEDLHRFVSAEPIRAKPVRAWDVAVKWVRRNRLVAILIAVLLLGVVFQIVNSIRMSFQIQEAQQTLRNIQKHRSDK